MTSTTTRIIAEVERPGGASTVSLEVLDAATAARRILRRGLLVTDAAGKIMACPPSRVLSVRTVDPPGDLATFADLEGDSSSPAAPAEPKPTLLRRLLGG